ncbi:MAG: hypothetical protein JWN67_4575 [Actinomycetia bacterium]|nr:hypothetical protein [Actinomycetes bacterium]
MTGGFQDTELAGDLVGVTSARLLAAGVPRGERLRAMRLLGVLVTVADARRRVRRPLAELAVEFDLPVDEVDTWLGHLIGVGAVRWEDGKLVLAALEPPAAGGLRLHDFLGLVGESEPRRSTSRPHPVLRPAGAVLAAAAVIVLALLAPGVVRDRSTPASTTRDGAPEVATTVAPEAPKGGSASTVTTASPGQTVPGAERLGPVLIPSTTTIVLPCPSGLPLVQVLGTTTDADGRLAVDGLAHNGSAEEVVIRALTLSTSIGGKAVTAPGLEHEIVVPGYSTVLWQAKVPVTAPAGTVVQAVLGDWGWNSPDVPTTCPSP